MVLNLGLSGQPFAGPDIGGFVGEGTGEMFARWMGFGALFPFARGHTGKGNIDKEPWAFGHDVEEACRLALQGRYRLIPYIYTLFHEASTTGLPVWRPVFFADPTDPALRIVDSAFLLGGDLLVIAHTSPDPQPAPPLPTGDWQDVTEAVYGVGDHPDLPRLLLRDGAVLPLGPVIEHLAGGLPQDLTVLVNPAADGRATGWLYEDAGEGPAYRDGEFRLLHLSAQKNGRTARVLREITAGDWPRIDRRIVVEVFGP